MTIARLTNVETLLKRSGKQCRSLRWDAWQSRLRWTDAASPRVLGLDADGQLLAGQLPDPAQTIAPCASGGVLLGSFKRLCLAPAPDQPAISRSRLASKVVATIDAADQRTILGDGRTDRQGNFVFGTSNVGADRHPIGSFFQFSGRHGVRRLALPTVTTACALAFSSDGARLFFADGAGDIIFKCSYDSERAAVAEVGPFMRAAAPGMTIVDAVIDQDDCLWSLQTREGKRTLLVQYARSGAQRQVTDLERFPATGLAFGGERLDRLLLLGRNGSVCAAPGIAVHGYPEVPFNDAGYCMEINSFQIS